MCDRMTEPAREALTRARDEAAGRGHRRIGTEHVLLVLLGQDEPAAVLASLGVPPEAVRAGIDRLAPPDPRTTGSLPQAPRVKQTVELAMDEARRLGHDHLGPEHLLLGMLREPDSAAAAVLADLGVTLPAARAAVRAAVPPPEPVGPQSELAALDEAIVAVVAEKGRAAAGEEHERAGWCRRLESLLRRARVGLAFP